MKELLYPPRKDHIATYKRYKVLRVCADADLKMMVARCNAIPSTASARQREILETDVKKQKNYLAELDYIIKEFEKSLVLLSKTLNNSDYNLFGLLIIEGLDNQTVASKTNMSLKHVQNKSAEFKRMIRNVKIG